LDTLADTILDDKIELCICEDAVKNISQLCAIDFSPHIFSEIYQS